MKAFSFFFWALLGLGFSIMIPGSSVCFSQYQVTVTAEVLESITYFKSNGKLSTATNLNTGYWVVTGQKKRYIVAKF